MDLYVNLWYRRHHYGSPTQPRGIANKLGFGGYHTITGASVQLHWASSQQQYEHIFIILVMQKGPCDGKSSDVSELDPEKLDPLHKNADNLTGGFCPNAVALMEDDLVKLKEGSEEDFNIADVPGTTDSTTLGIH